MAAKTNTQILQDLAVQVPALQAQVTALQKQVTALQATGVPEATVVGWVKKALGK